MFLCKCPQLTPLQSRFLASLAALATIALIYWSLSDVHFAYAAELAVDGSGQLRDGGDDHNWHRIVDVQLQEDGIVDQDVSHTLHARAVPTQTTAGNNYANADNLQPGDTTVWIFPNDQLTGPHTARGPGLPREVDEEDEVEAAHPDLRRRDEDTGESDTAELETRQDNTASEIYISVNTCNQPLYAGDGVQSAAPPQLTLYVSTSADNASPAPGQDASTQAEIPLTEGYANYSTSVSGAGYMSVHAPDLPSNFTGVWNYEIAVSIDGFYHNIGGNGSNLYLIDSDSTAALLVTNNLTQANPGSKSYNQWMNLTAPYVVFANNQNRTATMGISRSYCGLNQISQVIGKQMDPTGEFTNVQMEMITRGIGGKPKEQFYITYLNRSSNYHATLAQPGNSTASGNGVVGGGGIVWPQMSFTTKTDGNCALLYNLDFCDQVAYAVPSSPDRVDNYATFQNFYDNNALTWFQNFNYSLQQIPCDTDSASQYSLARNCSDCYQAYKQWLCAVSIPRCEDFTSDATYLQIRNVGQPFLNGTMLPDAYLNQNYVPMSNAPTIQGSLAFVQTLISSVATNQSRNPAIDAHIAPGPYKEVLPCEDLCYNLVQSCPAALGFGCPYPGRGLEVGYGTRSGSINGSLTCSYLGAYVPTDAALALNADLLRVVLFAASAAMLIMVGL